MPLWDAAEDVHGPLKLCKKTNIWKLNLIVDVLENITTKWKIEITLECREANLYGDFSDLFFYKAYIFKSYISSKMKS